VDTDISSGTPVALLAQTGDACERLEQAIREAGGNLVLMADPNSLNVAALQASKAAIALVVLEPEVEDAIDELAPTLEATGIELMFEEADVVIARKNWELQRWKRHLAAKLQGHQNVMPTGQEDDSTQAIPAASYASAPAPVARAASASPVAQRQDTLDDFAAFDFGSDSADDEDSFGLDDLSAPIEDNLIEDSLSVSGDSILDDLTDLTPDSASLSDNNSLSASAFDDFSFDDDSDTENNGGLADLFAADDLSSSTASSFDSLDDLTDLAPDTSSPSDSLSFSGGSSAFDDFSFDDNDSTADSGLGDISDLSMSMDSSSSLDDLSQFSADTDDSLLDLASDSTTASDDLLATASDDLEIFPSALDDSDILNLDDMLAPATQPNSSLSSEVGIDESFAGFDSFDSFSNDDLSGEDELSNLLGSDTGMSGGGGGFADGDSNVAVSVEELMALVSAAKGLDGAEKDKDKHSHLDNKQPQIGGPSGEFEKWGLADPDTVAEVIETRRNDPNRSDQAERVFSAKDISGVLGSLEARLEDMLEENNADDLSIAFGSSKKGGGGGGGQPQPANHLHGGGGSGAGATGMGGGGRAAANPAPNSGQGQYPRQQRAGGNLGDPGTGSGPVVVLAGLSGIDGVRRLLGTLPAHFPYPVFIRLKMPTPRYANLAMQMGKATALTVMLAEEGQSVGNSIVYILPDQMGLMASGRELYFSSGSSLLEALPDPGNAVVAFSGADPEQVPEVLNFVNHGGWGGTQSRDNCFQPEAVNQLVAAGLPSGEPEDIGHLLIQRCGVSSRS